MEDPLAPRSRESGTGVCIHSISCGRGLYGGRPRRHCPGSLPVEAGSTSAGQLSLVHSGLFVSSFVILGDGWHLFKTKDKSTNHGKGKTLGKKKLTICGRFTGQ